MALWRKAGWEVLRTAGSHGKFDVIAYKPEGMPVFLQCKVIDTKKGLKRLVRDFLEETTRAKFYFQAITIKIKGTKTPLTYTV